MTANGILRRGFSLIELVIVVVIIGIIAAIAIPRMSRGAAGAQDSAMVANLSVLRSAIDLYAAEHDGAFPDAADFEDQLTQYTDTAGAAGARDEASGKIFGPYLREIPPVPAGSEKGSKSVAAAAASGVGWVYNETTGKIIPNTGGAKDTRGVLFTDY